MILDSKKKKRSQQLPSVLFSVPYSNTVGYETTGIIAVELSKVFFTHIFQPFLPDPLQINWVPISALPFLAGNSGNRNFSLSQVI